MFSEEVIECRPEFPEEVVIMPSRLVLSYASCPDALLLRRGREATVLGLGTHVLVLSQRDHLSDFHIQRGPQPCCKPLLTRHGVQSLKARNTTHEGTCHGWDSLLVCNNKFSGDYINT